MRARAGFRSSLAFGLPIILASSVVAAAPFSSMTLPIQLSAGAPPDTGPGAPLVGYHQTRLTFYSGATTLIVEGPRQQLFAQGVCIAYLDGNGDASVFSALYAGDVSGTSPIWTDAALRVRIEVLDTRPTSIVLDVPVRPGVAQWAVHSADTAQLAGQIGGLTQNLLTQANQFATTAVNGESTARQQGDQSTLTSAQQYTDQKVAAETTARQQGDQSFLAQAKAYADQLIATVNQTLANLQSQLTSEAASRQQGDQAAVASAASYTDVSVANEASVRAAGDSNLQTSIDDVQSSLGAFKTLLASVGSINGPSNPIDWTQLKGVPPVVATGYQPGTGIAISGSTISNTGLLSVAGGGGITATAQGGAVTLGTVAGGDVTGALSGNTVSKLQGVPVSTSGLSLGQVLAYNGSQWQPSPVVRSVTGVSGVQVSSASGDVTLSIPSASINNSQLTNSYVNIAAAQPGLAGGGVVSLGGTVLLRNTGVIGIAASDGITTSATTGFLQLGTQCGGDLAGNLASAEVRGLQGRPVDSAAPVVGDTLIWDGTKWTPGQRLCVGTDCRTSFNNEDANSINPMPRTCPVGQIAVSSGPYAWRCSPPCSYGTSDCDGNMNNGCEINIATDPSNCGFCGNVCPAATPHCSQGVCGP